MTINVPSTIPIFEAYCRHEGEEITRASFEKSLAFKRDHKDFRLDMRPLFPPGVEWDFNRAYNMVLADVISLVTGEAGKD